VKVFYEFQGRNGDGLKPTYFFWLLGLIYALPVLLTVELFHFSVNWLNS